MRTSTPKAPEGGLSRARAMPKSLRPGKLWINPTCGLFETPRWMGVAELRAMATGTKFARQDLGAA